MTNIYKFADMILIAPDKFKGTFTAAEICAEVERRLRKAGFVGHILSRPLSDGGEGIASVIMPDGKEIAAGVYESPDGAEQLAVSSEIIGFKAFARGGVPLMLRSSIALGKAIRPRKTVAVAIGGTATADGGAGFLQGLGVRFFDSAGNEIREPLCPATLFKVADADTSALSNFRLRGIVDVRAGLVDGSLTALDFARQKALPGENLSGLEGALRHFQNVMGGCSTWDGAGGGLGYALASVAGADCVSGAEAAVAALDINWDEVNLIITGEGKVDRQTVEGGKLVDALWREGSRRGIPVAVLYGAREESALPYEHLYPLASRWEEEIIGRF